MQDEKPDSRDPSGSANHELPPPGVPTRSMGTSDPGDPSGSANHELPPPGVPTRSMGTSDPLDPSSPAPHPSPPVPRPSPLIYLLRAVASLKLAVVLIAVYTAVLVWATAIEKLHGTAAAHTEVYGAGWFVALHVVIAVNILAAVLIRFPWRPRQTGFVVTHLGVVVLLVGCLLSWRYGSKAQLPVVEGRAAHLVHEESRLDSPPVELGFQVFLHKFRRKLDPGAAMASHYSSLVDFLDRDDPTKILQKNVLITLNAPVDFTDPRSGRTYRLFQSSFDGPWTPGEPAFRHFVGDDRDRDHVYRSVLSVNYDPGRRWKYIGSLLIVAGIVLVYYVRPGRSIIGIVCISVLFLGGGAQAGDAERLDWSAWQHLPAFGEGRVEPLDTFARKSVEAICGRTDPTLVMEDGRQRKFAAAELLFAWLAETERWEHVPFLPAEDEWLRCDVLELPLRGGGGRRLSSVSPAQVENNPGLGRYWATLQQRVESEGKEFRLSKRDRKVERLIDAYGRYRRLTFYAEQPKDTPRRFYARVESAGAAWRMLVADRQAARRIATDQRVRELMVETGQSLQKLIALLHEDGFSRKKIEPAAAAFRLSCEKLAGRIADGADKPLAALAAELRREAIEMHLALYDNGDILRLVPALNPGALEENRTPDDDASPWLGFQAMIDGSDDLLRGYPRPELDEAREAFAEVQSVYCDRDAVANSPLKKGATAGLPSSAGRNTREDTAGQASSGTRTARPAKFAAALRRFSRSLRALAEKNEPLRRRLPLLHRDESLLDATAYPPPGSTAAEVFYNRLNPFFWSWVVGLVAMLCLLSAVGRLRAAAFWLGSAVLTISLALTLTGLGLRTYITGLAPLTGMFESVVVVAAFVYVLGLWLALLPLVQFNTEDDNHAQSRLELVLRRRLFTLGGSIVGTLALILAYYAPATIMQRNIGTALPILRDNFWLVVHVVTIMAGYASAAIALILGNIALGYYLFGRYRDEDRGGRRPPAACSAIAGFIYTAIKITVLLLAAGTILGALWADKSWGRYWGWDPKEVWALISLMVYLWFLHARRIGWSGDFGMAATAILGATVILFNWYGVNFILALGLHAYASGAGGQLQVGAAVLIQWLFLFAAAVRYLIETRGGLSTESTGV